MQITGKNPRSLFMKNQLTAMYMQIHGNLNKLYID